MARRPDKSANRPGGKSHPGRRKGESGRRQGRAAASGSSSGKTGRIPGIPSSAVLIWGWHAVEAALRNPDRRHHQIMVTERGAQDLAAILDNLPKDQRGHLPEPRVVDIRAVDETLPDGAVHQGIAVAAAPLPDRDLIDILESARNNNDDAKQENPVVLVLDQVTDPHNVGAVLRSAAAFGINALVMQDRNSPGESGTLARAASGALDVVPVARVVNLKRTIKELRDAGFWCIGFDSEAPASLAETDLDQPLALVLGAEDKGLRRLVRESCDAFVRLPTRPPVASLNISNAAAIACYEARRHSA